MPTTTALGVARIVGRSEKAVDAYKDKDTHVIAKDLALGPHSADLIGNLGTPLAVPGAPRTCVATVVGPDEVSISFLPPTSDGGAEINNYAAAGSGANGGVGAGPGSPVIINHPFTQGESIVFQVVAINDIGIGAPGLCAAVTPNP
jgi:hypothetical protein